MKKLTKLFRVVYSDNKIITIERNATGITYLSDTAQCGEFDTREELHQFITDNQLEYELAEDN